MSDPARARLIKGLASAIYGRGVLIVGQVVAVPALVGRWGAGGYGEWLSLTALTAYLAYTNVGVPGTVRSDMAMADGRGDRAGVRESFQTCFALVCCVALLAGLGFVAAIHGFSFDKFLNSEFISPSGTRFILTVLSCQIVIYTAGNVLQASLSALGEYGKASAIDATRQLFEFASLIVSVGVLKATPEQASLIYLISSSLYFLAMLFSLHRVAPDLFYGLHLRASVIARLWRPMLGVLSMSLGYYGMAIQVPRIILAATIGPAAVAVYAVTGMLMRIVRIPIDIPAHSATVELSMAMGRGDIEAAQGFLTTTTRFCLWLALALVPIVVLMGPLIVTTWTVGRVHPEMSLLLIASLSTVLFSLALPSQEALMSVNRLDRATLWLLMSAPAFITLCWTLAKAFGTNGVAFSVLLLDCGYASLTIFWVLKHYDISAARFVSALRTPPIDFIAAEIKNVRRKVGI